MYFAFVLLGVIALLGIRWFYRAINHLDPNEPAYTGNFAVVDPQPAEELTVVSYNISYGRKLDQALAELGKFQLQRTLDILLLQEMEEAGVERMARQLQMNYIYFPATVEPKYRRNFGNAVLTRWPIAGSQKLILPHISLSDQMKRVATRAIIRVQNEEVVAYSIHTEPVFIWPKFKEEQCLAVLKDEGSQARFVIAGGDFNSFTQMYVEKLENRYGQAGFVRASKGIGYTFGRFGLHMFPDQIFTKGFAVKAAGKLAEANASDHLPVWAALIRK